MEDKPEYKDGMNAKTYDLLFNDKNLPKPTVDMSENYYIIKQIEAFTLFDDNSKLGKIKKKIGQFLFNLDFKNISFDEENKSYKYNYKNREIKFKKLSDIIKDENLKKELCSNKRYKQCHSKSMQLVGTFLEDSVKILTGICTAKNFKYLHSVIEVDNGKEIFIADYTKNILMKKVDFVDLVHFEEIQQIENIDYLEDLKDGTLKSIGEIGLSTKEYTAFRDELRKDLQKNKDMIIEPVQNEDLNTRLEEIKNYKKEKLEKQKEEINNDEPERGE